MVKRFLIFVLILMLVFPAVLAVEIDMKTNFSQGETFMAKVSGNFFKPLSHDNIFFYKRHVRISMNPYIVRIGDDFYIYAQLLGRSPDSNYSISIENAKYMKLFGEISEEKIVNVFSINENIADFSIDPGAIVANDDFFIELKNLRDSEILVQAKTKTSSGESSGEGAGSFFSSLFKNEDDKEKSENITVSISLSQGEQKKVWFKAGNFDKLALNIIELKTGNTIYEVPVYVFSKKEQEEKKERSFRFEPSNLNVSFATNSTAVRVVYVYNDGEEKLEKISLSVLDSLKPYTSIPNEEISSLESGNSTKIELIFSSGDKEKNIEGQITAKDTMNDYAYLAVFLNFLKDYKPLPEENKSPIDPAQIKTCVELNGLICSEDEVCIGDREYAKDGACCLGVCEKAAEKSSLGKIIGWAIIIAVILFLYWFFRKKYRGAKRDVDFLKVARGKSS